jgi:uncharacterized membrane protein
MERNFWTRLRKFTETTLIGGLLVLLPITIFIVLVRFVLQLITKFISPIAKLFSGIELPLALVNFISLGIVITFCFLVGLAVRTRSGNAIINYLNKKYLAKLPFYITIQETVKQIFGKKEDSFSRVVLIDVFGVLMTGFVTDDTRTGIYTVFVPTAPNPTNGFVFHAREDQLTFLDVKPEDAMRTVIGLGTGSQTLFKKKEKDVENNEQIPTLF